jgi:HEAT repeat protein
MTEDNEMNKLIADLTCEDFLKCQKARRQLVDIGSAAVPALIEALKNRKNWVRWEAAKALAQIGDRSSVNALVDALTDKEFDVRWLAAEGLIKIGTDSFKPLLKKLIEHPDSSSVQIGVHHVIHDVSAPQYKEILKPLMQAIEGSESLQIPILAEKALADIYKMR